MKKYLKCERTLLYNASTSIRGEMVVMHLLTEQNKLINRYPGIAKEYDTEKYTLKRYMLQEERNIGGNVRNVERVGRHKPTTVRLMEQGVHTVRIQYIGKQMKPIVWQRNAPSFWLCGILKTTTRMGIPLGTPVLIRAESSGGYADNPEHRYHAKIGQKCTICRQLRENKEKEK